MPTTPGASAATALQIVESDRESDKPIVRFYIPPEARWPVIRGTQPWPHPDTDAVTRGSGSKNENREKAIRRWFVEQDLVEGVVLLPDNLFYNTTAPGLIVLLNRHKPAARAGRIVLVNASREALKGQPKNYLPEAAIRKIADAFHAGKDVDKFVKVIGRDEAAANDYNLSPSRYIATGEDEVLRPIPEILAELAKLDAESAKVNREVTAIMEKLKPGLTEG